MKTEITKVNKAEFTSLKMAEITSKRHDNVMRDIRDEVSQIGDDLAALIFESSFIIKDLPNGGSKKIESYNMTKAGWLQIGARYDAKTRYSIISYANKLEKENTGK